MAVNYCWGKRQTLHSTIRVHLQMIRLVLLSFIEHSPKIAHDKNLLFFEKSNHCACRRLRRSHADKSNLWLVLKGWRNSLWMQAHSLISSIFISLSTARRDANLFCCQTAFFYQFAQEEALRSSDRKWSFWPVGRFYFRPSWHESQMLRCVCVVGVTHSLPLAAVPPPFWLRFVDFFLSLHIYRSSV